MKMDGSNETILLIKVIRGETKEFSTFTPNENIHKSIGTLVINNMIEKLAGKTYLFEFVLSSSNGKETQFKLLIKLEEPLKTFDFYG